MSKQELLDMKLHEVKEIPCAAYIMNVRRVFGGWIYTNLGWDYQTDRLISSSMCFVPEIINAEARTTDETDRTHQY